MQFWQRRAQQKASEDRRKGAKQGRAIVEYLQKRREEADKQREERLSEDEGVEGLRKEGTEGKGT